MGKRGTGRDRDLKREKGVGLSVCCSTSEMVSSRRCLMEWGSRRFAFFGVTFTGVATAPSLAICAVVEGEEVGGCGSIRWSGRASFVTMCGISR